MAIELTEDNTYVALEDAEDYFEERLNADSWHHAEDIDKMRALIMSAKAIDQLNFSGEKTDPTQVLQFPRYDDEDTPTEVQEACFECALAFLDGVDLEYEKEALNVTEQRIGGVKVSYDSKVPPEHIIAGIPSYKAWLLLKPYLRSPDDIELYRV